MAAAAVLSPTDLASTASATVSKTTASNTTDVSNPTTPMSDSELFVYRISSVLQSLGYNDDSIQKVASRVAANTVTGNIDLEDISIQDIGQLLDEDLLNHEKLRSRNVYLNSNEPVLLLEIAEQSGKGVDELTLLKENFIDLLRARSIVPVRVYVRRNDEIESSQFGFCLLNVVNTDIGGPSMVQLLDAAFHGEGWKKDLIMKEAFDGVNLLWRDEIITEAAVRYEEEPTTTHEPEVNDLGNDEADSMSPILPEPVQEEQIPLSSSTAYKDINEILEEHDEDPEAPIEHPAMVELREWEASRQHVEHPTWVREHDGDLLDIITTQSASIKDEDADFTTQPASDDFELIEKK